MSLCTTSTGLFYAYAKNINDDVTYRYLITFATRDVADTWYRAVTDSVAGGYARFKSVNRVSLQFFTHNPGEGNIPDTITDGKVALSLRGQVFFTLINDRDGRILSVIPILNYTQNKSGDRFYVRSASQPGTYWYYNLSKGLVVASEDRRTKFTITLADKTRPAGTVMISTDDVYITTNTGVNVGVVSTQDQLGPSTNPFPFGFSSFNGDFEIDFYYSDAQSSVGIITRNPGKGERWELV